MTKPARPTVALGSDASATGLELDGRPAGPAASLVERIAGLELQLAALKRDQAEGVLLAIAGPIPAGVVFSSADLWRHQTVSVALRTAFVEAGIGGPRVLGKRLAQWQHFIGAVRLARLWIDHHAGVLWTIGPAGEG
jgi:hypothetical protein